MFERFTRTAREVVIGAVEVAEQSGAPEIGEEHLLASLVRRTDTLPSALGLDDATIAHILAELHITRQRGGLSDADAEALASIGIDLDVVIGQIESELGGGAFEAPPRKSRRLKHSRMSSGAKAALQGSLRQAALRKDDRIRPEHLLLGLLMRRTPVADALGKYGITIATAYAALDRRPA